MSGEPPISAFGLERPSPSQHESSDDEHAQPDTGTPIVGPIHEPVCGDSLTSFENRIAQILPWLHEASNPYWDWLWASPTEARIRLEEWLRRPSSEFSEKHVVCWNEGARMVGGYIALPGQELQICRKGDLLALMNYLRRNPHESVIGRMRQARSLFASVAETEFYLSRIGVSSSARGCGVGRLLLEMFIQEGRGRGFNQCRLDVSTDNERAVRLYHAAGFAVASESAIAETPIRYYSMVKSFGPQGEQ
jgi:ribosomal protein S18 acetylase RimI-like enzyme